MLFVVMEYDMLLNDIFDFSKVVVFMFVKYMYRLL